MNAQKGLLSGRQMMFSIACFIQSASLLTSFLAGVTLHDSWIAIVLGIVVFLPVLYVYRTLMVAFPDKNLMQIFEDVYGKTAGKIISVCYLWFFFTLAAVNLTDMGDFIQLTILDETPLMVITLMCVIVVVMAVRGGVRLVTRYGAVFSISTSFILFLSMLMVANQFKFENFLPMFDLPFMKYVQGTHIISSIPFGEIVIFLMIHPSVGMKPKETAKYLFGGFAAGALVVVILMARDIAVLGNTMDIFTLPSLISWYLINLGPALSRMEILFFVVLIILLFFRISLLFYVCTLSVGHLFKTGKLKHLALAVGVFLMLYGFTLYPCAVEHAVSARNLVPFIWMPFEIILPVVTLLVAKLRRKRIDAAPRTAGGKEQP